MKKLLVCLVVVLMGATSFAAEEAKQQLKELVLTSDNTIVLNDAFTSDSVTKVMEEATKLDSTLKSGYPLYLFIYSPGGSIQAGLELIEFLNGLNRPVHTVTLFAASMGFQTVQSLGERYVMKYSVLMSHKARGGFQGEFGGTLSQLDSRFGLWMRRVALMDQTTVSRTKGKQTIKSYTEAYSPELWLNGEEAVKEGYADEVVRGKCDSSLAGTKEQELDFGFFSVVVEFSKCPLKTGIMGVKANIITNKGKMPLSDFLVKNGKFGEKCRDSEEVISKYNYRSEQSEDKVLEPELCAKDPKLTLEVIKTETQKQKAFFNRNLRDNVEYSY